MTDFGKRMGKYGDDNKMNIYIYMYSEREREREREKEKNERKKVLGKYKLSSS